MGSGGAEPGAVLAGGAPVVPKLTVGADWEGVTLITLDEEHRAGQLPGDSVGSTGTTTPGSASSTPPSGESSEPEDAENGIIGKPPEGVTCE